jgi:hypothetical protein
VSFLLAEGREGSVVGMEGIQRESNPVMLG